MKKIFFVILIFFLSACNNGERKLKYYFFTYLDKTPEHINIQGDIIQGRETGEWSFLLDDSKTSIQGQFKNGLKTGIWKYNINSTRHEVLWDIYNNPLKKIEINYPNNWVVSKDSNYKFFASIPTENNYVINQYFVLLSQHADSVGLSSLEYKNRLVDQLHQNDKILSHFDFQISNSNRVSYFLKYELIRNGNKLILYDFIGELNKTIIDFAYLTQNENNEIKDEIFFGIISGCYWDNERVLDPFKETTIKRID